MTLSLPSLTLWFGYFPRCERLKLKKPFKNIQTSNLSLKYLISHTRKSHNFVPPTKSTKMCDKSLTKCLLFAFNFVIWLIGLFMTAIGLWAFIDPQNFMTTVRQKATIMRAKMRDYKLHDSCAYRRNNGWIDGRTKPQCRESETQPVKVYVNFYVFVSIIP